MYYKTVENGYIMNVVKSDRPLQATEITAGEYSMIMDLVHNIPSAPDGHGYKLKNNLTWELYELPPIPEDDEISDLEALNIITGRDTDESQNSTQTP